jgi:DNA replication and repair protein RecF
VSLRRLEIADFRLFTHGVFVPEEEGTTVISGANGTGKTSVLEAIAYLGSGRSFRGAPREALVRTAQTRAIVRAELQAGESAVLVEAEIVPGSRSRIQLNRKPIRSRKDQATAVPYTIFSPEDLALVNGGPSGRRDLLDDALAILDPEGSRAAEEVERILRQRAALLRQASGRLNEEVERTLEIWDERLVRASQILVNARERLVTGLAGHVAEAYGRLAGSDTASLVRLEYQRSWEGELHDALRMRRNDDLRRAVTTVGPHRDDVLVELDQREARTHASQGEQRCLALALRLGVHRLVCTQTDLVPTLLLDDVFSELDPARSRALVAELPAGQSILTTAAPLPEGIEIGRILPISAVLLP